MPKLSTPVKIFAIVAVLATVAFAGAMLFLGGGASTSSAAVTPAEIAALRKGRSALPSPKAPSLREKSAGSAAAATNAATPKTRSKAEQTSKGKAKPKRRAAAGPNGLPIAVEDALLTSPVVVVALFAPDAPLDVTARDEAEAGAADAGAAFVPLNVLEQRKGGPLTKQLGLLKTPSVLVYQNPAELFLQLKGFVDREVVAQAAASAGAIGSHGDWGLRANAICREFRRTTKPLGKSPTREELLAWAPGAIAREQATIERLGTVQAPKSKSQRALVGEFLAAIRATHALESKILAAVRASDQIQTLTLLGQQAKLSVAANKLATRLGAPACGNFEG